MVAVTSSSTSFSLDVDDVIEDAISAVGSEYFSGVDASKARRTLNLLLIQLQNKNIPLHKLAFVDQLLVDDDPSYLLDSSITDVLECSIERDAGEDQPLSLPLGRYGLKDYQTIPNKAMSQRPSLFTTQRNSAGVTITFWPVAPPTGDTATYTAKMLVAKRVEDITAAYQKIDLPYRYLPLIVKWLSYELSLTKPQIPDNLRQRLKNEYLEYLPDTFDEDKERVDFTVTPGGISGSSRNGWYR